MKKCKRYNKSYKKKIHINKNTKYMINLSKYNKNKTIIKYNKIRINVKSKKTIF